MSKVKDMTIDEITARMGYFPTYGHPSKVDEDDDFVYYLFFVPRHYIESQIAEGETWSDYVPSTTPSVLDKSCVLGVKFLPVSEVVKATEDEDFLYYTASVPKTFLDYDSSFGFKYGIFYEMKEAWERTEEEIEEELEAIEEIPSAGELVKQVIDSGKEPNLEDFSVALKCSNDHITEFPGHTAKDVWNILAEFEGCDRCGSTTMEIIFDTEGEDDEED